jgi:hypothetical protein
LRLCRAKFCAFFAVKLSVHDWTAHFMRTLGISGGAERRPLHAVVMPQLRMAFL